MPAKIALTGIKKISGRPFADLTAPNASDWSIALPTPAARAAILPPKRVAVICHIYHLDAVGEITDHLRNIPGGFDLFISTDTEMKREEIKRRLSNWTFGSLQIRIMPNRGRDIAPKIVGFSDVHSRYDFVLHLHSKASTHHSDLAGWRNFLFKNLLGSEDVVRSIFEIFHQRPDIGMIGPQHFEPVRRWLGWSGNFPQTRDIAIRFGLRIDQDDMIEFPSGSMFWARPQALQPLIDLDLKFEDFPVETGLKDETLAHAIERLFYLSTERAGLVWVKVAVPELFAHTPSIMTIIDFATLEKLAPVRSRRLTAPGPSEASL